MTTSYIPGFGNHVATEAVPGALPIGRNSPQRPAYGLYAEQLSGTAFTAPRHENRRSWLYRLRPTAEHPPYEPYDGAPGFAPGTSDSPCPQSPALGSGTDDAAGHRLDRRDDDDARQPRSG
ncbi:hypothetical protein GCM10020258_40880 [Sphingomonas yabuuchiae]